MDGAMLKSASGHVSVDWRPRTVTSCSVTITSSGARPLRHATTKQPIANSVGRFDIICTWNMPASVRMARNKPTAARTSRPTPPQKYSAALRPRSVFRANTRVPGGGGGTGDWYGGSGGGGTFISVTERPFLTRVAASPARVARRLAFENADHVAHDPAHVLQRRVRPRRQVRRQDDVAHPQQRKIRPRRLGWKTSIAAPVSFPPRIVSASACASSTSPRLVLIRIASSFICASSLAADEVFVARQHRHVDREHVAVAVQRRLVHRRGRKLERVGADVEDVVVDHAHPEAIGRDVADAPADAAHAEDADRQLVELPPANAFTAAA
jgi:hypothetical protein